VDDKLTWNMDEGNPHGLLLELSDEGDTTLSFETIGETRSYFYFPQDDGMIEPDRSLLNTFGVKNGDYKRLRLHRGNFKKLKTEVDYPKAIKFMYWSSVYRMVYFDIKE